MLPEPPRERRLTNWTTTVFLLGLALTILFWTRSQVAGDQLNMLSRGWLLIAEGEWIPYGLVTSAGGKAPGGLTSILVGLPLALWQHHRAPTIVLILLQLIGYLALDRIIRRELVPHARLLFAVVYWLNPWRLYHSGFLWNSSYLMPLGALHFWTVYRQRTRATFWDSLLLVALVGAAAQLHAAAGVLAIISGLLWWRGYFRLHWRGAILGALVVLASLIPWALVVAADGQLLPSGESQHGRLAQSLLSMARGFGYWLRYAAMIGSSTMLCIDFQGPARWPAGDALRQGIQIVVGLATMPLVVWANVALWRRSSGWWRTAAATIDFRTWLSGTVRWAFFAMLMSCLITPTAVMSWQLLSIFHLAVMPLVLAGLDLYEADRRRTAIRGTGLYAAIALALILTIGFGSPMYRCGGDTCGAMNATPPPLRSNHEMLEALGIQDSCRYEVDVAGGWWPDVLPEE